MSIDKLDKVEAPPSYRVDATVETHDQRHGRKNEEDHQDEDEYSASGEKRNWQKYHTTAKDRKALKLRRQDIAKLFINHVFLQKGLVIIDANIELINGKLLYHSHLFSTKIDLYWRLKKIGKGNEIPASDVITEQYIEVSVLHKGGTVQTSSESEIETNEPATIDHKKLSLWPLIEKDSENINYFAFAVFVTVLIVITIAIIMAL